MAELLVPDFAEVRNTVVEVAGFPAVRHSVSAASPSPCTVSVGTAQGQFLEVRLMYGSAKNYLSLEQACELTVMAAEFAMQTLQMER